jgi:hypothetical protein
MVDPELFKLLETAIAAPEDYCEGDGKDRLRAAFDAVSSQVFAAIFGQEPPSRANARLTLNSASSNQYSKEMWELIQRLSFAIGEADNSLHRRTTQSTRA